MKKMKQIIVTILSMVISASVIAQPVAAVIQSTKDMIACTGKYALCAQAVCVASADGQSVNCQCPIHEGQNIGGTTCETRQRAAETSYVYSDYSPIHLLSSNKAGPVASKVFDPEYICNIPKETQFSYANCMDVKCKQNGDGTADCSCPVSVYKRDLAYMLEASSCAKAEKMCDLFNTQESDYLISAAPAMYGTAVMEASLLQFYGKQLSGSMICSLKDTKV